MKPWSLFLLLWACTTTSEQDVPERPGASSEEEVEALAGAWAPCGTTARRLVDIHPGPGSSDPQELVHGDHVLFFTAEDGTHGRELWTSSGTGGPGTFQVKDVRLGVEGSNPRDLTRVGDRIFFSADDGVHGQELWVSDGTAAGTHLVKDLRPGGASSIEPAPFLRPGERRFLELGGVLYFVADDGVHGRELWRSDGTAAGTQLVEDFAPGAEGGFPRRLARLGDAFYFVGSRGSKVHLLRGTGVSGAVSVLERVEDNLLFGLTPVKSRLFFLVDNDEGEASLWKTDGTAATTRHLRFFQGAYPRDLVALGSRLVFSAGGNSEFGEPEGEELWVSDGTVTGTRLLKDLLPGPNGSFPRSLAVMNGRVFFAADNGGGSGRELWETDGTAAGTLLLKDVEPGAGASSPEELTAIQGTLFFSAETVGRGRELWVSDGTAAGTVPLTELNPGEASSWPKGFVRSGWDVFFIAEDGAGRELWAMPFRPTSACDVSLDRH